MATKWGPGLLQDYVLPVVGLITMPIWMPYLKLRYAWKNRKKKA
jgi:hypothetical protein